MRRMLLAALLLGFTSSAGAGGFRHRPLPHGGFHPHHWARPGVVVWWSPFLAPYFEPLYFPDYVPPPAYAYPPPVEPGWGAPPGENAPAEAEEESEVVPRTSYGLVMLRDVPDGAAVDLDGRFWLTAQDLGARWLALPEGSHTLVARTSGERSIERHVEIAAGKAQVVRFASSPRT